MYWDTHHSRPLHVQIHTDIFIVKRVNFPRGPKIGKCGFSGGFLVKIWKDVCYPMGKLAGKVQDCSISWD